MTGAPEREFIEPAVDEHGRLAVLCHDAELISVAMGRGVCEMTIEPREAPAGVIRLEGVLHVDVAHFRTGSDGNIVLEVLLLTLDQAQGSGWLARLESEGYIDVAALGRDLLVFALLGAYGADVVAVGQSVRAESHIVTELARGQG